MLNYFQIHILILSIKFHTKLIKRGRLKVSECRSFSSFSNPLERERRRDEKRAAFHSFHFKSTKRKNILFQTFCWITTHDYVVFDSNHQNVCKYTNFMITKGKRKSRERIFMKMFKMLRMRTHSTPFIQLKLSEKCENISH